MISVCKNHCFRIWNMQCLASEILSMKITLIGWVPVSLSFMLPLETGYSFLRPVILGHVEVSVAEQLTSRTPDLEVGGSSLSSRLVSLDKELKSTLSLFAQVYKWELVTYCWGLILQWTSILSRREWQYF